MIVQLPISLNAWGRFIFSCNVWFIEGIHSPNQILIKHHTSMMLDFPLHPTQNFMETITVFQVVWTTFLKSSKLSKLSTFAQFHNMDIMVFSPKTFHKRIYYMKELCLSPSTERQRNGIKKISLKDQSKSNSHSFKLFLCQLFLLRTLISRSHY